MTAPTSVGFVKKRRAFQGTDGAVQGVPATVPHDEKIPFKQLARHDPRARTSNSNSKYGSSARSKEFCSDGAEGNLQLGSRSRNKKPGEAKSAHRGKASSPDPKENHRSRIGNTDPKIVSNLSVRTDVLPFEHDILLPHVGVLMRKFFGTQHDEQASQEQPSAEK